MAASAVLLAACESRASLPFVAHRPPLLRAALAPARSGRCPARTMAGRLRDQKTKRKTEHKPRIHIAQSSGILDKCLRVRVLEQPSSARRIVRCFSCRRRRNCRANSASTCASAPDHCKWPASSPSSVRSPRTLTLRPGTRAGRPSPCLPASVADGHAVEVHAQRLRRRRVRVKDARRPRHGDDVPEQKDDISCYPKIIACPPHTIGELFLHRSCVQHTRRQKS